MDVIDQLFHELPPPCQHHAHPGSTELVAKCNMALEKFVEGAYLRPSTQSHFEFLKRIAVNAIRNSYFWDLQDQLGKLALEQPRVMDGDSMRANYFRYCHWLIMGRRDAEQALWSQAISQHTDTVEMTTETQNEETMAIAKPLSLFQALFVEVLLATLEEELIFLRTTSTRITAHFVHPGTDQSNGRCLVRDSWLRGTPLDSARLAVLTAGCCGEVLTTTKPLFDLLLGPFFKSVEEIDMQPRNVSRLVQLVYPERTDYATLTNHYVLRATTHSGTRIAIDCTGAQFGWPEISMPWAEYEANRVHHVYTATSIGPGQRQGPDSTHQPTHASSHDLVRQVVSTVANSLQTRWSDGIEGLVKEPMSRFDKYQSLIVMEARMLSLFNSIQN